MTVAVQALLLLTLAAGAQAQTSGQDGRAPSTSAGFWSVGVDVGFSNPIGDDDFDAEPLIAGYGEYFFSPHVSFRGTLMLLSFDGPGFGPPFPAQDVDIVAVLGNVYYTWTGRTVLPFITGGVGLYNYDSRFDDDLEVGINFGGGANFHITRQFAIKLEGTFHGTSAEEPDSFFNAVVGARWVFGGS